MSFFGRLLSTQFKRFMTDASYFPRTFFKKTNSGEIVTPENAMSLSAYFACIKVIAEDLAKLPVKVYKKEKSGRIEMNSTVQTLLNIEPNPVTGAVNFRETITAHVLGWGGGFAEIERNYIGDPLALWLIHPTRIRLKNELNEKRGSRTWIVKRDDGTESEIDDSSIFHIFGLSPDGRIGYTPADIGRESLGIAMSEVKFGAEFFSNGTQLSGVLEHPERLTDESESRLKKSWNDRYQKKKHTTAILEEGMKYHAMSVSPKDAQFIEGRQFSVEEICRWFRMAPHKVQHLLRATFTNIEHQNIDHVVGTLQPWASKWENEIDRKLLNRKKTDIKSEFRFQSLLRGDNVSRASYYRIMHSTGTMCPDEIRAKENMPPRPDGKGKEFYKQPYDVVKLKQDSTENKKPEQPDNQNSKPKTEDNQNADNK